MYFFNIIFAGIYDIFVEDFMRRDVKFLWKNMTYKDLKQILKDNKTIHVFPVVHSPGMYTFKI